MSKSKKFYAVRVGREPGVYDTWDECKEQTNGFKGAKFKSWPTRELAEKAVRDGWDEPKPKTTVTETVVLTDDYIKESISVDAACSGNPGEMEYQCVDTATGAQLFSSDIYPIGTNNIGEFLGVVDALRYLHDKSDSTTPVYTDSRTAISWVKKMRVNTDLPRNEKTEALFTAIEIAIQWLQTHPYTNPVLKWETKHWGESKADFGRK